MTSDVATFCAGHPTHRIAERSRGVAGFAYFKALNILSIAAKSVNN